MHRNGSLPVVILGLTLGAGLGGACAGSQPGSPPASEPATNPPPPEPPPPEPVATNPPPPEPEPDPAPAPATASLPTWDEVASKHPPGATNPPRPVLLVSPEGRCFKQWVSPMVRPPAHQDRIEPCDEEGACGTEVVCPAERAAPLLESLKKQP
jgi:hypothetical protein